MLFGHALHSRTLRAGAHHWTRKAGNIWVDAMMQNVCKNEDEALLSWFLFILVCFCVYLNIFAIIEVNISISISSWRHFWTLLEHLKAALCEKDVRQVLKCSFFFLFIKLNIYCHWIITWIVIQWWKDGLWSVIVWKDLQGFLFCFFWQCLSSETELQKAEIMCNLIYH